MHKLFLGFSGVAGAIGVGAGAFGAHALRGRLADDMMRVFETAVLYQLVHAVGLAAVAALATASRSPSGAITASGWCFASGILIFSGSLYAFALTGLKAFGAVTPIGGVAFLAGWSLLFIAGVRAGR
jgi:uncharacterized membrane protein YgdD (TMEM256/DUF423 family)